MDPKIWKNLPTELVRKIIEQADLSIDTKICFKITPKKLDEARAWRLWYLLKSHDGIIYNLETETLHNFRVHNWHMVKRPIKLDWLDDGLWSFNQDENEHILEIYTSGGDCICWPMKSQWLTELRVLLKGSGLTRMINASGWSY
jgi:hypothetical protein